MLWAYGKRIITCIFWSSKNAPLPIILFLSKKFVTLSNIAMKIGEKGKKKFDPRGILQSESMKTSFWETKHVFIPCLLQCSHHSLLLHCCKFSCENICSTHTAIWSIITLLRSSSYFVFLRLFRLRERILLFYLILNVKVLRKRIRINRATHSQKHPATRACWL